jgi:hypothetical protein
VRLGPEPKRGTAECTDPTQAAVLGARADVERHLGFRVPSWRLSRLQGDTRKGEVFAQVIPEPGALWVSARSGPAAVHFCRTLLLSWRLTSRSIRRKYADETLQAASSLEYRGLDPSMLGGLLALGDDGPNNVGDKFGRDPALQVSAKSRSHQGGQLPTLVRHVAHPAVGRGLLGNGAGLLPKVVARVVVPMALRTPRWASLRWSHPSTRGLRSCRQGVLTVNAVLNGWVSSTRSWLHRVSSWVRYGGSGKRLWASG